MSQENEQCTGSCSTCSANCASRQPSREELLEPVNKHSKVKRVIGVVSGKGGVGKSFITSYLCVNMQRKGYRTAIMDADITGPSIPKSFGVSGKTYSTEQGMIPAQSNMGTKIMSINLLVDKEDTPVLWRGPVIAGAVKQFWTEVCWGDVDYMFVDMPPGTGDVPMTVFQSIPLDGIIIVTSPQELVSMIVKKAVNMARTMDIPILGIVENYSYITCECCGKKMSVFGESHLEEIAKENDLKILAKLPLDPKVAKQVDEGKIENLQEDWLVEMAEYLEKVCPIEETDEKNEIRLIGAAADENGQVASFAKCTHLAWYHLEDGQVVSEETYKLEAEQKENTVSFIVDKKADVLICQGIGFGAMQDLMGKKVMVVPGQNGMAKDAVKEFLEK